MPPRRAKHKVATPQARWRERNWESGKCGYCGNPTGEEDFRLGCENCRNRRAKEERYRRHFLKDFV